MTTANPTGKPDSLTIWHVISEESTITFLHEDMMKDWISDLSIDYLREHVVIATSQVTQEEYDRMTEWRVPLKS